MSKLNAVGGEVPTNGAERTIDLTVPYTVNVKIEGVADLLFHRWNCESVEEKSKAAKGSKAKKTDDVESYVYRNAEGFLCLPGEYVRQSCIMAAKFRQDPRSPRKSAFDLFKAALVSLTDLASLGSKEWEYLDKRRVCVQRNSITRSRPAFHAGWKTEVQLMVTLPEYVSPQILQEVLTNAGRLVGVGDFRPTYGRYQITSFDVGFAT